MLSEGFDKYVHRWKLAVVQNGPKRTENINKNTIRDGGSTALYAAYTVGTVYTVDNVDMVYTADMVYTFDTVYTVDIREAVKNYLADFVR